MRWLASVPGWPGPNSGESCRPRPRGGRLLPGLVIDIDASLVTCHSEKESAAATFKGGFGYHPLLAFLDNAGEALAGLLRPGNAGSNTAVDHITVTDLALAQIPDTQRYGCPILIRADGAGATRDWLAHLCHLRRTPRFGCGILGRVHYDPRGPGRDRRVAQVCVDACDRSGRSGA